MGCLPAAERSPTSRSALLERARDLAAGGGAPASGPRLRRRFPLGVARQREEVAELLDLGPEVALVGRVDRRLEGHALGDLEAVARHAAVLRRVVREEAHRAHAEVEEDLRADAVVAVVGLEAEPLVGLDGVEPLLLERVRADLVEEADAAALLAHVEGDAAALGRDAR